jgi:hypothetical protein
MVPHDTVGQDDRLLTELIVFSTVGTERSDNWIIWYVSWKSRSHLNELLGFYFSMMIAQRG